MAKFTNAPSASKPKNRKTPVQIVDTTSTYEGGVGFVRDAKSELFFLAINNMVGENTFYESAKDRDARFQNLVRQVTKEDPEWMQAFIPFLREKMFMRSASTVAAAEYVYAGGPNARRVVDSALQRPDEPAEILAYWLNVAQHSNASRLPFSLKRGIADAARRLYNEKSVLKYDGVSRGFRVADVLALTHPGTRQEWQKELFAYAFDRRYGGSKADLSKLPVISAWKGLQEIPQDKRRSILKNPEKLAEAGLTWESLSGYLGGPMDAEAWEAIIPSMGYMALLRNLRNFDEANISEKTAKFVFDKLSDPEEIARSKQFPFRFYSAYKNVGSSRWTSALEKALDLSTQNIPALGGTTLILVDTSGSMGGSISARGSIALYEMAALFGIALAKKGEDVQYVEFASTSGEEKITKSTSVLRALEAVKNRNGKYGHGTEMWPAVRKHFAGQDRVVILTDMQVFGGYYNAPVSISAPVYGFNLVGYKSSALDPAKKQYEFGGGLTDATFTMLSLIESVGKTGYPWEQ